MKKRRARNFEDPKYIEWRKKVYKRDKYKCQFPGCKLRRRLNAHHIRRWADFPTLRFILENGITLCQKHHKQICGKEEQYVLMFLQILLDKIKREYGF